MTKDEALELALMALEHIVANSFYQYAHQQVMRQPDHFINKAITDIKEALAQPYQEPVAYGTWDTMIGCGGRMMYVRLDKGQDGCTVPLYTHPLVPTAQPEQEPVAWAMLHDNGHFIDAIHPDEHLRVESEYTHPLYTTPPQRTWVGLTAKEKHEIRYSHMTSAEFIEFIEAKLKEKNT